MTLTEPISYVVADLPGFGERKAVGLPSGGHARRICACRIAREVRFDEAQVSLALRALQARGLIAAVRIRVGCVMCRSPTVRPFRKRC